MFALPWNTVCVRFLGEIWRAAAALPAGHRPAQPQSRPDVQQPLCEQPDLPPPVQLSCAVWSDSGSGRRPAARVQGSLQRDLHLHPKNESGPRQEQTSSQGRWFQGLCQVIILFTTLGLAAIAVYQRRNFEVAFSIKISRGSSPSLSPCASYTCCNPLISCHIDTPMLLFVRTVPLILSLLKNYVT